TLPDRTAWIFRQYRIEGQSQRDIAHELGISLSAVEKHLQRAYKAVLSLRSRLDTTVVSLVDRKKVPHSGRNP
ncbi:sigma factor-like helix-turn-helix DNA-binding protein, partial [Novosphingobium pentaromativorans]|uniref:sigma factor-like helix-turn-helix DNA-binding protein n=1 Tax=Novosphingobium pentaromativorans TaxID=205844 RepID=UPI00110F82B4